MAQQVKYTLQKVISVHLKKKNTFEIRRCKITLHKKDLVVDKNNYESAKTTIFTKFKFSI